MGGLVPGDHLRDLIPRHVARDGVHLREDRGTIALVELEALQAQVEILVGHRRVGVGRAVVAVIARVDYRFEGDDAFFHLPRMMAGRPANHGPPTAALEHAPTREAVKANELYVTTLADGP